MLTPLWAQFSGRTRPLASTEAAWVFEGSGGMGEDDTVQRGIQVVVKGYTDGLVERNRWGERGGGKRSERGKQT